jgi:hypothetical protein
MLDAGGMSQNRPLNFLVKMFFTEEMRPLRYARRWEGGDADRC